MAKIEKNNTLPVYDAIAINQKAIHSGSTQPCIMTLADKDGNIKGEYVVKVFKPSNLSQSFNTNKEVYGSVLASEFDLMTPEAVLANVNQQLIDELNNTPRYKGFNLIKGTYFATKYIDYAMDFSKATTLKLEDWEIENIFAFDVLIRNQDRRHNKPNLFYKDNEVYLIDHELSLATGYLDKPFPEMVLDKNKYWRFVEIIDGDFERKHIFLDALRERNKKKSVNFDTFREDLRNFDVDILDDYVLQLKNFNYDTEDYYAIKSYLIDVKNNPELFIKLLKDLML